MVYFLLCTCVPAKDNQTRPHMLTQILLVARFPSSILVALPLSLPSHPPPWCVQLTTGAGPNITKAGAYSAAETYSPSDIADLVTYAAAHGVQLMYVGEGKRERETGERWREMQRWRDGD